MNTIQTLVDEILGGQYDSNLNAILVAAKNRQKIVDEIKVADIQVGDEIVTKNLSPKYMSGHRGTVVRITDKKFRIRLDDRALKQIQARKDGGRRYIDLEGEISVPRTCIEHAP